MMGDLLAEKLADMGGNPIAMMVYPAEMEGGLDSKPIATSTGWSDGKPEVSRRFENVLRVWLWVLSTRALAFNKWVSNGFDAAS